MSVPPALLAIASIVAAGTFVSTSGTAAEEFRILNAMLYRDMPDVGERVPMVYESTFFPDGRTAPDGGVSEAGIAAAVADARAQRGPPWHADAELVLVDIERWLVWPFAGAEEHATSIGRYADAIEAFGDALDEPLCLYAIAPEAGINHANRATYDRETRRAWRRAGDVAAERLVPALDALCPALYTYYDEDDPDAHATRVAEWRTFAVETMREARRLAPDKPLYPFLWPRFHAGGNVAGHPFVPEDYWRVQLETVREHADGLILWGGWDVLGGERLDWDPEARWWEVFRDVFPDAVPD